MGYTPRRRATQGIPFKNSRTFSILLGMVLALTTLTALTASNPPDARAAATLAPAEPAYPIPSTAAPWTSANGLISMSTTRTADGSSCELSNGRATAPWTAASGGDGGDGDGRVCAPSINNTPATSVLTYGVNWSVNATGGNQTFVLDLPDYVKATDFTAVCSNKAGIYTVASVSNIARRCTITVLAGAVRSGTWTLGVDLAATSVLYGYRVPTMTVAGATVNWPAYNLLNVPVPYARTKAASNGTPDGSVEWVRKLDGTFTARWRLDVMVDSNPSGGPLTLDSSALPAGAVVSRSNITGGYRFTIEIPYSSLGGPSGTLEVPVAGWQPNDGVYTDLTPYAGVLNFAGYGQAVSVQTGNDASQVGYGGTLNETWSKLTWGMNNVTPFTRFHEIHSNWIRPGANTWSRGQLSLNQPQATIGTYCIQFDGRYSYLDTTRDTYIEEAGGTKTNLTTSVLAGQRCDGTGSANLTSVYVTGFPTFDEDSVVWVPLTNTSPTDHPNLVVTQYIENMGTDARTTFYSAVALTTELHGIVSQPATVAPGTTVSGTIGYDAYMAGKIADEYPMVATVKARLRFDPCMTNIQFDLPSNTTIELIDSPNYVPGVPRCRGGDVGYWIYEATTVLDLATQNSSTVTTFPFTYDLPAWARSGRNISITSGYDGSLEVPVPSWGFPKHPQTATATVAPNPNVIQAVIADKDSAEVGERIGWTLFGSNDTGSNGTGQLIYEFDRDAAKPVVPSDIQLTASGDATLAMVETSTNGTTWTPWNPASTEVVRYLRMNVADFHTDWFGELHLSFDTDGSPSGSTPRMRGTGGTTSFGSSVIGTSWAPTTLFLNAPAVSLTKTAVGEIEDVDEDGLHSSGDKIHYELLVENVGTIDLEDIAVADSLTSVSCPATSLSTGEDMKCTAVYTLTQADVDAGEVVNNADVEAVSTYDNTVVTDTDSETTPITRHALVGLNVSPNKSLVTAEGDQIVYSFTVTNTGNTTLSALSLDDDRLAWLSVTCGSTTLIPSQSTGCTGTYEVTGQDIADGGVSDSATINGTSPIGPVSDTKTTFVSAATSPEDPDAPILVVSGL